MTVRLTDEERVLLADIAEDAARDALDDEVPYSDEDDEQRRDYARRLKILVTKLRGTLGKVSEKCTRYVP